MSNEKITKHIMYILYSTIAIIVAYLTLIISITVQCKSLIYSITEFTSIIILTFVSISILDDKEGGELYEMF